jgi:hypothetical protein
MEKYYAFVWLFYSSFLWASYQTSTPLLKNKEIKRSLSEALTNISKRSPDSSFSDKGDVYESNDTIVYQKLTNEVYDHLLTAAQKVSQADYDQFVKQRRAEYFVDTFFCCCAMSSKGRFKMTLRCAQNYEKHL